MNKNGSRALLVCIVFVMLYIAAGLLYQRSLETQTPRPLVQQAAR